MSAVAIVAAVSAVASAPRGAIFYDRNTGSHVGWKGMLDLERIM